MPLARASRSFSCTNSIAPTSSPPRGVHRDEEAAVRADLPREDHLLKVSARERADRACSGRSSGCRTPG